MNNIIRFFSAVVIAGALALPASGQNRHNSGGNSGRQSTERRVQSSNNNASSNRGQSSVRRETAAPSRTPAQPNNSINRNQNNQGKQPGVNRQSGNNNQSGAMRPGRENNNNQSPNSGSNGLRPGIGNNNQPGNNNQQAPNQNQPGNQLRPGGNNNQHENPNVGNGNRPGLPNNNGSYNRPGRQPNSPGAMHTTPPPQPPLQRPVMVPPMRPDRPPMHPYYRPVPPSSWRPVAGGPILSTILGIALGTAIDASLNYLYSGGYIIDGYDRDVVYLRNVNQLNYLWQDAALYYGPYGLAGSRFIYSTLNYDPYRYNMVYRDLVRLYGNPVELLRQNGGYTATWFGAGNNYVQLQFAPERVNGTIRYFTTLSFGN